MRSEASPSSVSDTLEKPYGLRAEGVQRRARECRKMFAMFRQLRVFSMPSKGAYLPSAERSRGNAGCPRAKQIACAYEAPARSRNDFELSEQQHDLPTVTRSAQNPRPRL